MTQLASGAVLAGLAILSGCSLALCLDQRAEDETLTVRRIQLKNDAGNVIAVIEAGEDGGGVLTLRDAAGSQDRVQLGSSHASAFLRLMGSDRVLGSDLGSRIELDAGRDESTVGLWAAGVRPNCGVQLAGARGGGRLIASRFVPIEVPEYPEVRESAEAYVSIVPEGSNLTNRMK